LLPDRCEVKGCVRASVAIVPVEEEPIVFCQEHAKKVRANMAGLEHLDPDIRHHCERVYGPYVAGDYPLGSKVTTPATSGTVLWSYRAAQGLVYIAVDSKTAWPVEVLASQVVSKVTPWEG